jgi:alpha-galactosidase
MTGEMLAAEAKWLPQFKGRKLRAAPAIAIPKGLKRADVPLDPALAIANRFQILAEQKTTKTKKARKGK